LDIENFKVSFQFGVWSLKFDLCLQDRVQDLLQFEARLLSISLNLMQNIKKLSKLLYANFSAKLLMTKPKWSVELGEKNS